MYMHIYIYIYTHTHGNHQHLHNYGDYPHTTSSDIDSGRTLGLWNVITWKPNNG